MSDDQQEPSDPKPRVRKIVRSAATAERPGFETPPAAEGEAAPASRKWDVRAERPATPVARPQRPPRARPGAPRPISPDGTIATPDGEAPPTEGGAEGMPQRPRRFSSRDDSMPRRPGVSGGRAMPSLPHRGPADRSDPSFVDKWMSMPPRKIEDRPPPRGPRPDFARPDGPPGDRPNRGDRRDRGPGGGGDRRPQGRMEARQVPAAPVSAPKLPTLHETILVGLPKVMAPGQKFERAAVKPKTAKEALAAKALHSGASKPKVEAEPEGEIILDPTWLTATAKTAAGALQAAGPATEALVDAWIKANNSEAIGAASNSEALTGNARKAAKRAANVMRSRGVALPTTKAVAAVRPDEEEIVEATFSPPDSRGTMSFTIAKRKGGERAHIAEIIVREGSGIVNAVSGWMSRSQIKEAHQRIADANGIAPTAVSAEWARWRVIQALKENATSGQLVPLGLERCKDLLDPSPTAEPTHPASDLEADLGADGEVASNLHGEPEFRGWVPEPRAIDELVQKVGAKLNTEDAKDSGKVDEILKEEIKLAADRYFTPEQRTMLSRRMRDIAISIRQRVGDARAKEVLRTARAIESAGLISSPPSDIEFLRFFFQKGIAFRAQQGGGQLRVPVSG